MKAGPRASRPSTESLRAPDRRRLYEQLAARLLDYVEVTGLGVGDRLPSEAFEDIPEEVRQQLTFVWLERVDDAVSSALEPAKQSKDLVAE